MNQYLRIPRGINVNQENDLILKKTIEEIGKQYGRLLLGKYRSNYAKGKAFLAKEYGLSKTAIKKMHTVKISASGHNNIGDNYSNYVSLHILLTDRIIVDIIKSIKEQKIDFERIATDISNSKYNSGDLYIDALFEETLHWMRQSLMDIDIFNLFNKSDDAQGELNGLYNRITIIMDKIGEK